MDQSGLWVRMTQWLRRGPTGMALRELPRVGPDGLLEGLQTDGPAVSTRPGDGPVRRLSKQELREQAMFRLENAHEQLVSLMVSIRQHLDAQDRQGQALAESLQSIGGHLSEMSQAVVKQTEALGVMTTQLQSTGERTRRLEEALTEWPSLAEAQRATLKSLADQVSAERQAVERISDSVGAYGGTLLSLDKSTSSASDLLRTLHASTVHAEEMLAALDRRQRKWLVPAFVALAAIALLAGALVVIALVR